MSKRTIIISFIISSLLGFYIQQSNNHIFEIQNPVENYSHSQNTKTEQFNNYTNKIKYFPSSGHWVNDQFLSLYESVQNPAEIFGYPITDAYQDTTSQLYVQYFEKAKFEQYIDIDGNTSVKLVPLGKLLYSPSELIKLPTINGCKTISSDGYRVCFEFLEYFEANGGEEIFGNPISNMEVLDHHLVQHFEYSRFGWRLGSTGMNQVVLDNLGIEYFEFNKESRQHLNSHRTLSIPLLEEKIFARIFNENLIVRPGENLKLYISVYNQYNSPVVDALVVIKTIFPSGSSAIIFPGTTDEHGIIIGEIFIDELIETY